MTLRVLLAGQEAAGAQILKALAASDHEVVAVLTQEPASVGGPASLAALARTFGLETLPADLLRDPGLASRVRGWGVDILLNVHSLHIVAGAVLEAPNVGSFNLHPGPLPEYAGLNTVGWAIYNGERDYGVTVHWMVPEIDAGPIAFQERFPIEERATALTLAAECTRRGIELLRKVLQYAADDPQSIPAHRQDLARRTYYGYGLVPHGGKVDWDRSAAELDRLGRAFDYGPFASPWGRPFMTIGGQRVELVGLRPVGEAPDVPPGTPRRTPGGLLQVACADAWISISRLYLDGSRIEPQEIAGLRVRESETGVVA